MQELVVAMLELVAMMAGLVDMVELVEFVVMMARQDLVK